MDDGSGGLPDAADPEYDVTTTYTNIYVDGQLVASVPTSQTVQQVGSSTNLNPGNQVVYPQAAQQRGVTAVAKGSAVTYSYPDGSKVVLSGTHPWRDNNPGDLKSGHGSIGRDAGGGNVMAIYPTAAAGWSALAQTLTGKYGNMSIIDTMKGFAPATDGNNPVKYAATLAAAVGVPVSTRNSALSPAQLMTIEVNIAVAEGYFSASNSMSYSAPPHP